MSYKNPSPALPILLADFIKLFSSIADFGRQKDVAFMKIDWYQLGTKDVFEKLNTSEKGLSESEVKERLSQYGYNKLAEEKEISKLKIVLDQFKSPLIYILLIAATVTTALQEYIDTGVILIVVILNAIIGFIQEYKAEESVRALKKMVVQKARVFRAGKEKEIDSSELVPGDIVLLTSGSKIPADIRLFKTIEFKIDEAMLTGESIPSEKTVHSLKEKNLTPGDQKNMAFMGTIAVAGRAKGLVVETGSNTVLGQIAKEVKELTFTKSPLQTKIVKFAKLIGIIVFFSAVTIFILGLLKGAKIVDMLLTAVAASVATVPEGLPIVVTITLAIGISRMARRNAIIRKLTAVETLGSTTVIGSDKTGTLTKNEMTVKVIFDGIHSYSVTGTGYDPTGKILHELEPVNFKTAKHLQMTLRIGMLCNESGIYEENGLYKVEGDPTEGALIVSAMKAGFNPDLEKEHYPQISIIPFESEFGYMATLHSHDSKKFIFIKGAPEKLLEMCKECAATDELRVNEILKCAHNFAKEGMRVLAMAYKEVSRDMNEITRNDVEGNLIFAGIQGMLDPPRPEAIDAVKNCKTAGIKVVMITGDHVTTALAIARTIGITGAEGKALTGKEIEKMSDEELFDKVSDVSVFARVSPQHKLRITQQLIRHGEIVAVTGDGVNDAPALKAAHIGVAMGLTGTDVAKEASDMVIVDDNFASIFNAVEEGRVVFDNIRKVTLFLIPTGFAAVLSILGTIVMGIPIPYVPAQLLWINLVTNGLQDVALAFEPGEKGVVRRPPRNPKEGIMSSLMIQRSIIVGLLISAGVIYSFMLAIDNGASLERARTIAVTTMVFFQFFQAWNCRSETVSIFRISLLSNPFLFYTMIAAFFAQLAFIYVPALQWVFRTEPLKAYDWLTIMLPALSVVLVVEIDKMIRRKRMNNE